MKKIVDIKELFKGNILQITKSSQHFGAVAVLCEFADVVHLPE